MDVDVITSTNYIFGEFIVFIWRKQINDKIGYKVECIDFQQIYRNKYFCFKLFGGFLMPILKLRTYTKTNKDTFRNNSNYFLYLGIPFLPNLGTELPYLDQLYIKNI